MAIKNFSTIQLVKFSNLKKHAFLFLILSPIIFLYTNCSSSSDKMTELNSDKQSATGTGNIILDNFFSQNGCLNYPQESNQKNLNTNVRLFKLSDGFLVSSLGVIVKHSSLGEVDLSWANNGYLRGEQYSQILNSSLIESFTLLGVDNQDRLLVHHDNLWCRLKSDLTLDETFGPQGDKPGCIASLGKNFTIDSSGNYWIFKVVDTHLYLNIVSNEGVLVKDNLYLGKRSDYSSGLSILNTLESNGYVYVNYSSWDANQKNSNNLMTINTQNYDISVQNIVDIGGNKFIYGLGKTELGHLVFSYSNSMEKKTSFYSFTEPFTLLSSFNQGMPVVAANLSSNVKITSANGGGFFTLANKEVDGKIWVSILQYSETGEHTGSHESLCSVDATCTQGNYNIHHTGDFIFATLGSYPARLCRFKKSVL